MMRHQVAACWSLLAISFTLVGCGNPQANKLSEGEETVAWEPLDMINSPDYLGGVEIGLGMGDPGSAVMVLSDPEFKAGVDKVENEALPSAWSDKDAQRKELVTALRELIAAAEDKKISELKPGLDKVKAAILNLKGIPAEAPEE